MTPPTRSDDCPGKPAASFLTIRNHHTLYELSVRRRGQCRPPYHMIICIESHLGDIYLSGKTRTKSELKRQLLHTEAIRDVAHDNFVPLLCRLYGWELTAETAADFTWDRDTELLLPLTHQ